MTPERQVRLQALIDEAGGEYLPFPIHVTVKEAEVLINHDRRVSELLHSNNELLERARRAEMALQAMTNLAEEAVSRFGKELDANGRRIAKQLEELDTSG